MNHLTHMRTTRLLAVAAISALAVGGATIASAHTNGDNGKTNDDKPSLPKGAKPAPKKSKQAGFELGEVDGSGVEGVAYLKQKGKKVRGYVAAWGLAPGTMHANHIHGPRAKCFPESKRTDRHAIDLPELMADSNGVAYARIKARSKERVVHRGYYMVVHMHGHGGHMGGMSGMTSNPYAACGNVK